MNQFEFKCRATNFIHQCSLGDELEPEHPESLMEFINTVQRVLEGMSFKGFIKSKSNNYQIDFSFDSIFVQKVNEAGWKNLQIPNLSEFKNMEKISPDNLITNRDNSITIAIEIEKANKKTIGWDFIKLAMLIRGGKSNFGLLVVPVNYAHKSGVWDLFKEARHHRYCLRRYLDVDGNLLSKIAIMGYTQEGENAFSINRSLFDFVRIDSMYIGNVKEHAKAKMDARI